ncbi:MAG: sigma 54-interacting transcriptional regulator [Phycisphaerales bacterium]|nr:sigma 54-interacting transcriptional regulator [Phycisphaerales bacterium]
MNDHPSAGQPSPAPDIRTLAQLRASGYRPRSVKQELREHAMARLTEGGGLFPGIVGYEDTVEPQIASAVLSGHDLLLLGLRGQAKTRMLRAMVGLLDEWMPVIDEPSVELRDDPMMPRTSAGRRVVAERGDQTPVRWVHRSDRYIEKLATPDVTIADLIGEIDLVKYAQGRAMSDEGTMHFGLIPRASRGLFVINELPDLSPRIQVGLFNVLEERDVQIRGYSVRLDLDVCLMFSANPEDYTNRGRIVTPLKDRIGSVVRTHYPLDNKEAMRITRENAFVDRGSGFGARASGEKPKAARPPSHPRTKTQSPSPEVIIPPIMHEIIEETIRLARKSPHINQASGVSVRASIAALENVVSSAEMRGLKTGEARVAVRACDLAMVVPALRGKIELMLAEDAGSTKDGKTTEDRLIEALVGEGIKSLLAKRLNLDALSDIADAFKGGLKLDIGDATSAEDAVASFKLVDGLTQAMADLGKKLEMDTKDDQSRACLGELVLEYLYVNNRLSKRAGAYTR